jgi:hypothetical protein
MYGLYSWHRTFDLRIFLTVKPNNNEDRVINIRFKTMMHPLKLGFRIPSTIGHRSNGGGNSEIPILVD